MKIQFKSATSFPKFGMAIAKDTSDTTSIDTVSITDRFGVFFEPTTEERQDFERFAKRLLDHLDKAAEHGTLDKYSPGSGGSRGPIAQHERETGRTVQYRTQWPLFLLPFNWQTTYRSSDRTLKFTLMDWSIRGEAFDSKTGKLVHSVEYTPKSTIPALVKSVRVRTDGSEVTIHRLFETGQITAIIDNGRPYHINAPVGNKPLELSQAERETYGNL